MGGAGMQGNPMPAEFGTPAPEGSLGPTGEPGVPMSPLDESGMPVGKGGGKGVGALPGGSVNRVLEPDCEEFKIPPSLAASRRAASEAYWAFEKALGDAEMKVEKAMNELVMKGA
uniref:Uncharacterized protein n=1 Tax=Alexandrium andersonii TaxID=327968 RepID=A0A7S2MH95_9DINO|mmetsp:Transcript_68720/g.153947  ORF Transcript_68720/g.153947 Transcript_68720/m.153947 type:complete len:115 (+) Transcript_68720:3-347(+)